MAASKNKFSKEYINGVRLFILSDIGCRQVCRDVLFGRENLPIDGRQLYNILKPRESAICQCREQYEILCPLNRYTDYTTLDITLLLSIIDVMWGGKYNQLVKDLRYVRNRECHRGNRNLSDTDFKMFWEETANILDRCGFDFTLVDGLKAGDLFLDQQFRNIAISLDQQFRNLAISIQGR